MLGGLLFLRWASMFLVLSGATLPIFIHPHAQQLAYNIEWQDRIQRLLQRIQHFGSSNTLSCGLVTHAPPPPMFWECDNTPWIKEIQPLLQLNALQHLNRSLLPLLLKSHLSASRGIIIPDDLFTHTCPGTNFECATYHHTTYCVIKHWPLGSQAELTLTSLKPNVSLWVSGWHSPGVLAERRKCSPNPSEAETEHGFQTQSCVP